MNTRVEALGNSGAKVVRNLNGSNILELPTDDVITWFRDSGVLIFRGFGVDAHVMKAFADRFTARFNRDRLRPPLEGSDGLVQMVTEGMGYAEAHSEQADSPFRPDAIWFVCEIPASDGGETLYWDGVRLWDQLEPTVRAVFSTKKLRYFHRYSSERWRMFMGPGSTLGDVRKLLDSIPGVSYHVSHDEAVYLEYVCSAVVKTRHSQVEAFTNSLLSERKNTLGELMSFDDGTPITNEVVAEVKRTMEPLTEAIQWEPGDLAFIDNWRFLHGRNAFKDTRRKIYSSLSFLNF